jgi:hypothetical protein
MVEAGTDMEKFAVTDAFVSLIGANARHISDVPNCTFVRCTSTHVNPPPLTLVTVVFGPEPELSPPMKANSSSFPAAVENVVLEMLLPAGLSFDTTTSVAKPVGVTPAEEKLAVTFPPFIATV